MPSPWKSLCLAVGFLLALTPSLVMQALPQSAPKPSRSPPASREDKTFTKIEELIHSKDYEQAESLLEASLPKGSPPAQAYFRIGKPYFDQDEWARAKHCFEKSLQAGDDNDQAHLLLGLAHREMGRAERAEGEFMKAVNLNPRSDVNTYFAGQQVGPDGKRLDPSAGWTGNKHGHYDSHIPETFTYGHFSTQGVGSPSKQSR